MVWVGLYVTEGRKKKEMAVAKTKKERRRDLTRSLQDSIRDREYCREQAARKEEAEIAKMKAKLATLTAQYWVTVFRSDSVMGIPSLGSVKVFPASARVMTRANDLIDMEAATHAVQFTVNAENEATVTVFISPYDGERTLSRVIARGGRRVECVTYCVRVFRYKARALRYAELLEKRHATL